MFCLDVRVVTKVSAGVLGAFVELSLPLSAVCGALGVVGGEVSSGVLGSVFGAEPMSFVRPSGVTEGFVLPGTSLELPPGFSLGFPSGTSLESCDASGVVRFLDGGVLYGFSGLLSAPLIFLSAVGCTGPRFLGASVHAVLTMTTAAQRKIDRIFLMVCLLAGPKLPKL